MFKKIFSNWFCDPLEAAFEGAVHIQPERYRPCRKCNYMEASYRYFVGLEVQPDGSSIEREELELTCKKCRYQWCTPCADADTPVGTWRKL